MPESAVSSFAAAVIVIAVYNALLPESVYLFSAALIYLYGVYVPPTTESYYTFVRPLLCGPRASIALEFKISSNFVHCTPQATTPDGSLIASCSSNGEDLSAWMLQSGWAVALPGAPAEYQTLERAAQAKGIGIWGNPIESIHRWYGR